MHEYLTRHSIIWQYAVIVPQMLALGIVLVIIGYGSGLVAAQGERNIRAHIDAGQEQ